MFVKIKNILLLVIAIFIYCNNSYAQDSTKIKTDTDGDFTKEQEQLIDDVIENRRTPQKDKVQYFSQLTRYGFKNLFPTYTYNTEKSYSSQVNPHAEAYMQEYLRKYGRGLVNMKTWCMPYFNLIDNILTQYGLPKELKYLAVIESSLKPSCTSWVGAAGPWQFMPVTGKEMGLVINSSIDERRDYFKSTHAAARYLLELYKQTKDWLLVIAAYNGGPGRVFSAIKKSGSRNFWDLQYFLPEESRNHVKKYIATHYIMEAGDAGMSNTNSNAEYAVNKISVSPSRKTGGTATNPYNNKPTISIEEMQYAETQTVTGKFNSVVIAKNLSMDILSFNRYNPLFDNSIAANGRYELILPLDKMQLFLSIKYQILNECVQIMLGDTEVPGNVTTYPNRKSTFKKTARSKK
jgi:membrane-bound lytic murein transglycosylase D